MDRFQNGKTEVYEQVAANVAKGKFAGTIRRVQSGIGDFSEDPQSMVGFKKGTGRDSPTVCVGLKVMSADSAGCFWALL